MIQRTLTNLEQTLQVNSLPGANNYQRLRGVAEKVLHQIEEDYQYSLGKEQPWNDRITALRNHILGYCEQQLGIDSPSEMLSRERTYQIKDALKSKADALESFLEDEGVEPPSEEQVLDFKLLEKSTRRILNFDAIYDGYVGENPTPERFLDTLNRLEREVFEVDTPTSKGYQEARVKVGNIINLKDSFADYKRDRKATVKTLVLQIQQSVQGGLDKLNQL